MRCLISTDRDPEPVTVSAAAVPKGRVYESLTRPTRRRHHVHRRPGVIRRRESSAEFGYSFGFESLG